jgi:hypothetical protein
MELPEGWTGGTRLEAFGRSWELERGNFQGFQYFVPNSAVFMRFTFDDGAGLVVRLDGVDHLGVSPGDAGTAGGWATLVSFELTEAGRLRLGFAGGEVVEVGAESMTAQRI